MAEGAHQPRQVLRTDHDDRNDGDDEKLRPTDVEHGRDLRPRTGLREEPRPKRVPRLARFLLARRLGAGGGLAGAGRGCRSLCSMTLGSGCGSAGFSSSSAMPFLKLLMPWATSPISSEILPRPNRSTNSTSTIRMCDQLNPISDLQARGSRPAVQFGRHYGSKARPSQAGLRTTSVEGPLSAVFGLEDQDRAGIDPDADLGAFRRHVALPDAGQDAARRAPAPRPRPSRHRRGSAYRARGPARPAPASSSRTPRWRTQTMASLPSAMPPAKKRPSAVCALPCSIRAGSSFKSEKVRAARMSFGAR